MQGRGAAHRRQYRQGGHEESQVAVAARLLLAYKVRSALPPRRPTTVP